MKEKLISIATDTVQRAGVHAITMRNIGSAAGIKSSSVMYHFKNKMGYFRKLPVHIYSSFSNDWKK